MKNTWIIWGLAVALIFTNASVQAASSPMLSTFTNISAEADPHTGSANFGIPIQVVPGRGGIEPNLSLQYNSSSPNGMLGLGWSMEIGSIRRSTKDGIPTYNNATDTFVLLQNGSAQDLVYDSAADVYRPKIEGAFMNIKFSNGYWLVRDRSGIQYFFGETDASRELIDSSKVFSWKLSKVVDLNGNTMTFTYWRNQNMLYPSTIEYTSNPGQSLDNFAKVEFVYETRLDKEAAKYNAGLMFKVQWRLSQILIKAANTLQRRYDLAYTQSPQTSRSLLTSVTQVGNNGSSTLPPAVFTYQNDALSFNMATLPATAPGNKLWVARMANPYPSYKGDGGARAPNSGGQGGYAGLDWSAPQTAASGNWGASGSWSTNASGSLTVNAVKNRAYHFTTYVSVSQPTTLQVNFTPNIGSVGVWINGNYTQNAWSTWVLQPGSNLIDLTMYNNSENMTFNLNYNLANNVQSMNSEAPLASAQLVAEFNADTLGDLARVDTTTGKLMVSMSSCLNFLAEQEWLSGIGANDKVILGDYNSDGRTDVLVYRASGSTWDMYFSNGTGLTAQSGWGASFNSYAGQFAAADYNGDGRPDLLAIHNDGTNLWVEIGINTGATFNTAQVADYNIGSPTQTASIGDFNGDGLMDYAVNTKSTGTWRFLFNSGGLFPTWPDWTISNFAAGYDPVTADFNGDGLTDAGYYNHTLGKIKYRPSNGASFDAETTLPPTFNINVANAQVTPVDLNGDTLLDVIISNVVTGEDQIAYSSSKSPDLLATVKNSIGGTTSMAYGSAHVCNCSFLPFPIQVVKSITVSNGINSYTTHYEYQTAVWDVDDREFRGFSLARVIDPDGHYSETNYLTDDIYKGRPSEQRAYDFDDHLFSKTVHTWDKQTIAAGVEFVFLKRKDNYVYDGDATGRRTAEEFFYAESPQYGNLTKAVQLGEVNLTTGNDLGADSRTVETTYVKNTASDKWLLGLPNVTTVKDHGQTVVRKTWFYYDGSSDNNAAPVKGLLTKKTEDGPGASDPSTLYAYDAVGNLLNTTDPLGRVTGIAYDTAYKLFPLTTTNALSHQVINEYYGINGVAQNSGDGFQGLWGQLKSTKDPNNQTGKKVYDVFGRPTASISPLDSITYPTVTTVYETGATYSAVTVKQRINSGQPQTIDASQVYDGLGRLSFNKSKSATEGTYVISGRTQYNVRGLPEKQYLPRFSLNPYEAINPAWARTLTEYDAMGRVVKVTAPDGTYSTMSYSDWTTVSIDANGRKTESDYDAYGRLVTKREYTGADGRFPSVYPASAYAVYATTQYQYDSEGNLVQTTDAANNITTITYDSLGRKTSMNDPDMGVWSYQYDLNGNLTRQTDAKNQVIDFTYDMLNRLVNKTDHAGIDVDYTYDDINTPNSKGRLSYVQYGLGSDQTAFEYDALGRETASSKNIGSDAYDVLRSYDALNRVQEIDYPDGNNIVYSYNAAGQMKQAASDAGLLSGEAPWTEEAPGDLFLRFEGADGSTVFEDFSPSARVITSSGQTQIDTAQFKNGASSGLFDGFRDYLTVPGHSDFDFGAGDFTIDFWVRLNSVSAHAPLLDRFGLTTASRTFDLWYLGTSKKLLFEYHNGSTTLSLYFPWEPAAGTWYHVKVVRSGTGLYAFINGTQIGSTYNMGTSSIQSVPSTTLWIGAYEGGAGSDYNLNGWLDDVRITKGQALFPNGFTPPGDIGFTDLFLRAEGADGSTVFTDSSPSSKTVTVSGNAQIDTAQFKNGASSGLFDGTGDYLSLADSNDWNFGSGDFTIDFWVRFSNITPTTQTLFFQNDSSGNYVALFFNDGPKWRFIAYNPSGGSVLINLAANGTVAANTWYHVAVVRSGNTWTIYLNGSQLASTTASFTYPNYNGTVRIGAVSSSNYGFYGHIDDLRVTKGQARWTSNFTP